MIKVTINSKDCERSLLKMAEQLAPEKIDRVVDKVALECFRDVVKATPKKWFGQVRRSWQITTPRTGARLVFNDNKVMKFIEEGTQAHGPKTAKALFIPLTRAAAMAPMDIATRIRVKVRKVKGVVKISPLKYGVDYILVKKVKGIKAMWIAKEQAAKTEVKLLSAFRDYIAKTIAGNP